MIGLDTNVIIRYMTQDDPTQAKTASEFIEKNCSEESPGYICHIVLCEISWVLESNYGLDKESIIQVIEELLQINQITIPQPETVWRALNDFKNSNADFSDHLIAGTNFTNGCQQTVTFDKKAGKHSLFQILE